MSKTVLQKGKAVKLDKGSLDELKSQVNSWTTINFMLPRWSLDEIEKVIYLEHNGKNRPRVVERLLSRRSSLLKQRDRADCGLGS